MEKTKIRKLVEFQEKLSSLNFFDPACGSGNFLTQTYITIRELENEVLKAISGKQMFLDTGSIIKVKINQFHGIEINDFVVTVAKTALWIAESQMMKRTEEIMSVNLDFLPLKSYPHIVEGNALSIDWEEVISKDKLNYIMGNPPFLGFTYMSGKQKEDMDRLFPKVKNLDFVCAWFKKSSDFIKGTKIECGFVSTNSITQGETVSYLWQFLDIKINFAYKTFTWNSEATQKASVHCVIIGFSNFDRKEKLLYSEEQYKKVNNINAYLVDAPNIIITSRSAPIYNVSKMIYGNKPADGGSLIIEDVDYADFIKNEPNSLKFIKPLLGATEYINNKKRWCLWLKNITPKELREMPLVYKRVLECKKTRENSVAKAIQKFSEKPTLFAQITQPENLDYIIIPRVSSEKRRYVPIGFLGGDTIVTDAVQIIPNAIIYEFGIIISNVHMAWMRSICGRLKSD